MGCLASVPDLRDAPIDEATAGPSFEARIDREASSFDLPLWYASLVSKPTWDEPKPSLPESGSRLFWRPTVARWSIPRRQAWGDRANQLQESGLDWKAAERLAFEEIMATLARPRA